MDFLEFFNLNEDPFRLTPDPFYFYPSGEHKEILESLRYVVEHREGFFITTGEPGTGKTTVLKVFINSWKDKAIIALILTPRLSPEEFLLAVMEDLGVKIRSTNKHDIIRTFRDFLIENALNEKRVIIIVDEAQNLPQETLEELRLLSNLETDKEKLLQIILIGQPELNKRLQQNNLKQLNQRITVRTTLRPLTMDETIDYINYRLVKGGKGNATFDRGANKQVYRISRGVPRLINLICSRAMMAAFLDGSMTVSKKHVAQAISHVYDADEPNTSLVTQQRFRYALLAAILLFVSAAAVIIILFPFNAGNSFQKPDFVKEGAQDPADAKKPETQQTAEYRQDIKTEEPAIVEIEQREKSGQKAAVRMQPELNAEITSWVFKDTVLEVIDETADVDGRKWYKVKIPDSRKEGWIEGKLTRTVNN